MTSGGGGSIGSLASAVTSTIGDFFAGRWDFAAGFDMADNAKGIRRFRRVPRVGRDPERRMYL
jgi:hypothetical protein